MEFYDKRLIKLVWSKELNSESSNLIFKPRILTQKLTGKKLRDILFLSELETTMRSPLELLESRNEPFIICVIDEYATLEEISRNKERGFAWIKRTPILFQHSYIKQDKNNGIALFQDTERELTYLLNRTEDQNNKIFVQGGLNAHGHYEPKNTSGEIAFKTISNLPLTHISEFPFYDFNGTSNDLKLILKKQGYEFKD